MTYLNHVRDAQAGRDTQAVLNTVVEDGLAEGIAVAIVSNERSVTAAASIGSVTSRTKIPVGCAVKVLTATLTAKFLAEGQISLDCSVGELLAKKTGRKVPMLRPVQVEQLLNHTHGLAPNTFGPPGILAPTPCARSGEIDFENICAELEEEESLFEPGRYFSYGHAGYGLLGGLLECLSGRTFAQSLRELLLKPLSIVSDDERTKNAEQAETICPAIGDGLLVSIDDLARLLKFFAEPSGFDAGISGGKESIELLFRKRVPLVGWCPGISGAYFGWKDYRDGWGGHNGATDSTLAMLRYHPKEEVGVALIAKGRSKSIRVASGRVFGWLPEFTKDGPRLLTAHEAACVDLRCYEGRYRNGRRRYVIQCENGALSLTVEHKLGKTTSTLPRQYRLILRAKHMFFVPPPSEGTILLVQFVNDLNSRGLFDYLWNGSCLWRRED